jgi:DNA-binding response OmpR family regulator
VAEVRETTALIVDDDPGVREFAATVLQRNGFRTFSARSAAEAMELTQTLAIDIFILDVELDREDGIDLAAKFRSQRRNAAVLLISGNAAHEKRAIAAGCRFLAKPFMSERLMDAVHGLLSNPEERRGGSTNEQSSGGSTR